MSRSVRPHATGFVLAAIVFLAVPLTGTAKTRQRNEPFDSFRLLDAKLTVLNQQIEELRKAVDQHDRDERGRSATRWSAVARRMRSDVAVIQRLTTGLRSRYRHSRFGSRSFTRLHTKATNMRHALDKLRRARTPLQAKTRVEAVSNALLTFLAEFQHISDGYAAVRCRPREWACCQPKPELGAVTAAGCAWECVARPANCHGFRGPRTPSR